MANTLLLVGGDLCARTARALDPGTWTCVGLRRRAMAVPAIDGYRIRHRQAPQRPWSDPSGEVRRIRMNQRAPAFHQ